MIPPTSVRTATARVVGASRHPASGHPAEGTAATLGKVRWDHTFRQENGTPEENRSGCQEPVEPCYPGKLGEPSLSYSS
jgi:hypothetical protein